LDIDKYKPQKLAIFRDMSEGDIIKLVEATGGEIVGYKKGDMLLKAYGKNDRLGILLAGRGQVKTEDYQGNEKTGHAVLPGALVGTTSAILSDIPLNIAVEATESADVLWIPYKTLITKGTGLGRLHGIFMRNILEAFARKNLKMVEKLEILSEKTLRERLIAYILQQEKIQGGELVKVPGRVQLSKELECNRSALTREIAAMLAEDILFLTDDYMRLDKKKIFNLEEK